jgi:hypothetical protein
LELADLVFTVDGTIRLKRSAAPAQHAREVP